MASHVGDKVLSFARIGMHSAILGTIGTATSYALKQIASATWQGAQWSSFKATNQPALFNEIAALDLFGVGKICALFTVIDALFKNTLNPLLREPAGGLQTLLRISASIILTNRFAKYCGVNSTLVRTATFVVSAMAIYHQLASNVSFQRFLRENIQAYNTRIPTINGWDSERGSDHHHHRIDT